MFKFIAVAAAVCVSAASALTDVDLLFEGFVAEHGKTYSCELERAYRKGVFAARLDEIELQNAEHRAIGGDDVFGINSFSDVTFREFKVRLGYKPASRAAYKVETVAVPTVDKAGKMKDWAKEGMTTPVKNQGQCGSCWAFSATEQIESDNKKAGNDLMALSPQQITSCDNQDDGCNGGDTPTAYEYVMKAGGLASEAAYPYTSGVDGVTGRCKFEKSEAKQTLTGYKFVSQSAAEEGKMTDYVFATGPLSICLAASSWMNYSGGILKKCTRDVDHCVQLVGESTMGETAYHIVRNSWGAGWGEKGYINIENGKNLCEIASEATYVTV